MTRWNSTASKPRADSKARVEKDHNALRQKFAEMLASEGGLSCSFNQTVSVDTLDQVKESMAWARQHPDIVQTMVFILFRSPELTGEFEFLANGNPVELGETYERPEWGGKALLKAKHVVSKIRELDPDFSPCAYLGGDQDPQATKWLLAARMASKKRGFGYLGPKSMEAIQAGHHFIKGTWLSYAPPKSSRMGRTTLTALSLVDRQARSVAKRYLGNLLRRPSSLLDRVYLQAFMIIQPIDILPDGRASMCDGCPDMTVHEGQLRWSCRLEEIKDYGCFLRARPRPGASAIH